MATVCSLDRVNCQHAHRIGQLAFTNGHRGFLCTRSRDEQRFDARPFAARTEQRQSARSNQPIFASAQQWRYQCVGIGWVGQVAAMDELETALERLASRSEYLASQVEKLARFNGNLRREVTESLREIDDLIAEQTNA
jgi:hypothetical protein